MYSEKVMDHFEHPRNVGEIENASGVGTVGNAKCGDIMRIYLDIDDDQIIRSHRQHPPGHLELPHPANYIKKFRTGMGVQQAVPVSSIFGRAHVQELGGGAVNGAGDPSRELITVVTHGRTPVQALGFLRLKLKLAAF